ncbi:DUF1684 domain-containing protein [Psychromicrobium xiongbiense]|uniref:DUF1684 domain-containing protein n=1 Tax=Psychromicrobium xiongbiense TaxID=3051184 RepID=UPI0025541C1F|nr:DUF1684 domain-containing protein [Psychromicrobium sp. YIM S02556]
MSTPAAPDASLPAAEPAGGADNPDSQWHRERTAFVTSPLGNLALVLTHWGNSGDAPVPDEEALAGWPEDVVLTRLERTGIDSGEPEYGYRIWQADSPANQAFERIDYYDHDPSWIIEGYFEHVADDRVIPFEHIRDGGKSRGLGVSGDLVFTRDGVEYRPNAFDVGAKLQLVFADATSGKESYGAGRFLYVARPEAEDGATFEPGQRFPVTLNFNRAFVPPCGFSVHMNCPLPPAQNRFRIPIRAGEKNVVFRESFELH